MAFAFWGASPQVRIRAKISSTGTCIMASGVEARRKSSGVTKFTRLSVVCAERSTATNRVNGSL